MLSDHPTRRLDSAALAHLPESIARPSYDRASLRPAIVHIGVGGFHRSHLATYVHELCIAGRQDWAIAGAGVLAGDQAMADALGAQDHLYTLITRGPEHTSAEVVGSIVDFVFAAESAQALIDRLADPGTQILSLTVTEAGYPVDEDTGSYSPKAPGAGTGTFPVIVGALAERRRRGLPGITILSCDNIVGNGGVARAATLGAAADLEPDLVSWIEDHVSFPNSMVDRITPNTTDADRAWLETTHGLVDRWPVVTEPFRQWVVEDHFVGDRPPFEDLDVTVTGDVAPYEFMKLRMLNAGHSCLAYLAALAGFEAVDQAMGDPVLGGYVQSFITGEAQPAVPPIPGVDLDAYARSLIERFTNPGITDQISRLCLDGSAKFPKFLLPTIRTHLGDGGPIGHSALALAGWCQYLVLGADYRSNITLASDPLLDEAVEWATRSIDDPAAFLAFEAVFDADLRSDRRFVAAFTTGLDRLRRGSVHSAIRSTLADPEGVDDRSRA